MIDKAPDAYRTISEVAEDIDLPQHVLRFWETRFGQIKPLKRGGGRRYYRPDDVELLKGIRHLLYNEGYTIKGVQRILKDQGPRAVQAVASAAEDRGGSIASSGPLGMPAGHVEEADEDFAPAAPPPPAPPPRATEPAFSPPPDRQAPPAPAAEPVPLAEVGRDLFEAVPSQPPAPQAAPAPPERVAPTVSFTRGGLRAPVVAEAQPAIPSFLQKRSRIVVQPPEAEEREVVNAPAEPAPAPAVHAGLSEPARRALQSALFELTECRRAIERIRASGA